MAARQAAGVSLASSHARIRRRAGFSLVEALVAITVLAFAGSVLLLAVESSLQTTTDAIDRSIADGIAQQLLDEIALQRFMEPGSESTDSLGRTGWEDSGNGRTRYNDTDDYHNHEAQPVAGWWGEPLGTGDDAGGTRHAAFQIPAGHFSHWRQRVEVYFVDPVDPSIRLANGTSELRAIEVHIERVEADGGIRPLASRKKVIAYVRPPTY